MRYTIGVILGALMFGAAEDPVPAQRGTGTEVDPFVIFATETVKVAWNVQATPIEFAEVEFVTAEDPPLTVGVVSTSRGGQEWPWTVRDGAEVVSVYELLRQLPDGRYRFRARVASVAKAWSDWTDWVYGVKDWTKPEKPGGCTFLFR